MKRTPSSSIFLCSTASVFPFNIMLLWSLTLLLCYQCYRTSGYWTSTTFLKDIKNRDDPNAPIQFYDSVTGELLFTAPVGRSMDDFIKESSSHGWPSFRDEECNWEHVRCLANGECVSTTGTHLGHNLPDKNGNRYCINLVSVAGLPKN